MVKMGKYTFFLLVKMYAPFLYAFPWLYGSVKKFVSQHGATFFGAWLRLRTFLYTDGGYMNDNIQKRAIDITGVELTPGEPTVCLGNGEQGFECCCDECDYYLLCFPEFDIKNISDNRTKQIENGQRT